MELQYVSLDVKMAALLTSIRALRTTGRAEKHLHGISHNLSHICLHNA